MIYSKTNYGKKFWDNAELDVVYKYTRGILFSELRQESVKFNKVIQYGFHDDRERYGSHCFRVIYIIKSQWPKAKQIRNLNVDFFKQLCIGDIFSYNDLYLTKSIIDKYVSDTFKDSLKLVYISKSVEPLRYRYGMYHYLVVKSPNITNLEENKIIKPLMFDINQLAL